MRRLAIAAASVVALATTPIAMAHEAPSGAFSQTKAAGDGLVTLQLDPATTGRNRVLVDADLPGMGLTDEVDVAVLFVMQDESERVELDPAGPGHAESDVRLRASGTWSASVVVEAQGGAVTTWFDVPIALSDHDDRTDPLTFAALFGGGMLTVAALAVAVVGRRRVPA